MLPRKAHLETQNKLSLPLKYVLQTSFLMAPHEDHNLKYLVIDVNEKQK